MNKQPDLYKIMCLNECLYLTYWGRGKMGAIFSRCFPMHFLDFLDFRFKFYQKFVHGGAINSIPALQAIFWTTDDSFIDAYMRHSASLS